MHDSYKQHQHQMHRYQHYQDNDRNNDNGETIPISMAMDAFDLTQVSTAFDDHNEYSIEFDQAEEPPSSPESFYMDLTRFSSYATSVSNASSNYDHQQYQRNTPSPEQLSVLRQEQAQTNNSPRTPQFTYQRVTTRAYDPDPSPTIIQRELLSPAAPSPLPEFQVFDLTHFLEDGTQWHPPTQHGFGTKRSSPLPLPSSSPITTTTTNTTTTTARSATPTLQPINYTLATNSSHDYQQQQSPYYSFHPNNHNEHNEHLDVLLESPKCCTTILQNNDEEDNDDDNIDLQVSNNHKETMEDYLFDRLCRGMRPADLTTVGENDREAEIRSCGTLPPDTIIASSSSPKTKVKTNTKSPRSYQAALDKIEQRIQDDMSSTEGDEATDIHSQSYASPYTTGTGTSSRGWTSRSSQEDSNPSSSGRSRSTQSHSNRSRISSSSNRSYEDSQRTHDNSLDSSSAATDTSSYDSHDSSVLDRREWLGQFVMELFQQDQVKSVYYATSIHQDTKRSNTKTNSKKNKNKNKNKKTTSVLQDYDRIQDFCQYVLQHLELDPILNQIDQGKYDRQGPLQEDFPQDLNQCLDRAMEQYEQYLDKETQKWNAKIKNEGTYNTQKRHRLLRQIAGQELKHQIETDFKMQLLDHLLYGQLLVGSTSMSPSMSPSQPSTETRSSHQKNTTTNQRQQRRGRSARYLATSKKQ